jgi:hypothetical protein
LQARKIKSHSLLRDFVRFTHRWPVLGAAYRGIYRAAADSVAQLAKRHPQIAGIYVRNSYALGTWEAGRSDIDFTVIWREPQEEEIAAFHSAYTKLQARFRMLGEVEMIDALHLDGWTKYGFSGLHSRDWKKLAGNHELQCQYGGSESLDRVRHGVAVYRYQFLKYFWEQPRGMAAERAAAKVVRTLGGKSVKEDHSDRLLEQCMAALSQAVRATAVPSDDAFVDCDLFIGTASPPATMPCAPAPSLAGVRAVVTSAADGAQKHVLVDDDFDLAIVKSLYPGAIVWNPTVFCFYLSFVDPLEYFALLRERIVCYGEDPFREPLAITESALRGTICNYAVDMLTYPYRKDVATLPAKDFQNILYGWYLRTLRYFEEGTLDFNYCTLREYFRNRHPADQNRFTLLRGIASELSAYLCVEPHETALQNHAALKST